MVFLWGADEEEEGLVGRLGRRRLLGLGLGLRVGGRAWVEVVRMVVRRRVMMDDDGYISNALGYFRFLTTKKQRFLRRFRSSFDGFFWQLRDILS